MTGLLLAALLALAPVYRVTGYTTAPAETAPWSDGVTAAGVVADPAARIVACPPSLAFGTKLWIEGLGWYTCLDRGGSIKGRRLDVLVGSVERAYAITGQRRVVVAR